jgi:hypothetical protein
MSVMMTVWNWLVDGVCLDKSTQISDLAYMRQGTVIKSALAKV